MTDNTSSTCPRCGKDELWDCGCENHQMVRFYSDRVVDLEAERDRLQIEKKDLIAAVQVGANAHSKVEDDLIRLRTAAQALRDDMLERSRAGMDVIHGEQYQVVNAGFTVWCSFCEALDAVTPRSSEESKA